MSLMPTYTCLLVNERKIDAAFDRSPWSNLPRVELYPVHLPLPSQADSGDIQRTLFSACNSETSLFFAFRCLDSDIWGTYTRRDEPLYEEEVVEAFLCPTGDLRHYYEFEVSPRNVVFDAMVYSPDLHRRTMQVDTSWDCPGLRTTVHVEGLLHTKPPDERPITITSTITNSERDSWWSVEIGRAH